MNFLEEIVNFNSKLEEKNLNPDFDEQLEEIIKHDIRGPFIDTVLSIKQQRDELIKKYIEEGNFEFEEDLEVELDPYSILENNLQQIEIIKKDQDVRKSRIPRDLLIHPKECNYEEIVKLDFDDIVSFSKDYTQILSKKENYFFRNAHDRCNFILSTSSTQDTFKLAKNERKLFNCRLIIIYRKFIQKIFKPKSFPKQIIFSIKKLTH